MKECEANECQEEAVYRCFWPGQTLLQCTPHKEWMLQVGEAMGFKVDFEFIDQAAYDSVTVTGSGRNIEDEK